MNMDYSQPRWCHPDKRASERARKLAQPVVELDCSAGLEMSASAKLAVIIINVLSTTTSLFGHNRLESSSSSSIPTI